DARPIGGCPGDATPGASRVAGVRSREFPRSVREEAAMKRVLVPVFLVLIAIIVACGSDNSTPQAKVFSLTLSPQNETPPCADAGVSATGTAKVTIPADNQSVIVEVTYSGLSGPATASHIHSGTAAAAGPVVLPFSAPLD